MLIRRFWRSHGFGHGLQHSAEIAVRGEDCRSIFFERSPHHIQAAQKGIEFLRVGCTKRRSVNRRGFSIGFSLSLERIFRGRRTDRRNITFLLATDVRSFAATLGTEARGNLVSLTGHALDYSFSYRWVIFAALETFIQQFNSEVGDFLPGTFGDLLLDLATAELDVRNRGGHSRAGFLQFFIARWFPPFRDANNLDEIMRCNSGARFAAQNVVEP